jgi:Flp pilus assembly protein TadD
LNPNSPRACLNLAQVLKNTGRLAEAEVYLHRAIRLEPDLTEAHVTLGATLMKWNRLSEAEVAFRRAVEINPELRDVYINLGTILINGDRIGEAETVLRHAAELDPDSPEVCTNLGIVLTERHRFAEAGRYLVRAGALRPDCPDIDLLLANLDFLQGRIDEGWEKYEARVKVHGIYQPNIRRWKGEDLTGKRILLYHEQGLGDSVQFVRFGRSVAELGGETVVWVQKPLQRLLSASPGRFITLAGESIANEPFDFACSLLSLPLMLRSRQVTFPRMVPYLQASREISARWRKTITERVGGNTRKVGVAWAGNPLHKRDHHRSIPIDLFRRLFDAENVSWISLQKEAKADGSIPMPEKVIDFSRELVDFAETAGVVENLDLVITVDTAVAHLSGALGKKTWLLLPFHPDARWQLEREDTPWYPTMRLFRQAAPHDWPGVLANVKAALSCQDPGSSVHET